jgi:hypothetical protein
MNVNEMFPSKYMKGSDLKGPTTVTILEVKPERIYKPGEGQITGYILFCEKASKGIVLTKPLAMSIAAALGEQDTDNWHGRQVVLYPQPMTVAGRNLVAIRARGA